MSRTSRNIFFERSIISIKIYGRARMEDKTIISRVFFSVRCKIDNYLKLWFQRSSVKKRARSTIIEDRYHFNDATRNATHDFDHLRASFNESWQRGTAGRFLNIFYGSAIKSKRPRANVPRFYRGRRILRRNKAFGFALGNIFIYPLMSCCAIHPRHTPRLRFPNTIAGVYIRN